MPPMIHITQALLFGLCLAGAAADPSPEQPGPLPVSSQKGLSFALASGPVTVDLYWPIQSSAAAPIVVVGHGFSRSGADMTGWGEHLASHGFVVAVPTFPNRFGTDYAGNGQRMLDIIAFVRANPGMVSVPLDPRNALVGHSAGGLSAFLAAAKDPSIEFVVGLDPVDAGGMGAQAAANLTQPTLVIAAMPGLCNGEGSAHAFYQPLTVPGSWFVRVMGASHCDAEDPSDGSCTLTCGGQSDIHHAMFRRYATAHLLAHFFCQDLQYLPDGQVLVGDMGSGAMGDLANIGRFNGCGPTLPRVTADAAGASGLGGSSGSGSDDQMGLPGALGSEDPDGGLGPSDDAGEPFPGLFDAGRSGAPIIDGQGSRGPCGCNGVQAAERAPALGLAGLGFLGMLLIIARPRRRR